MTSLSPRSGFGLQFSMISRLWRRTLDQNMSAAGLTDVSWSPLIHLDEAGDGVSQKELAALVGIDGSSLVRLLDRLEEKGHIERRADAADRRAKRLFLTPAGHEAVADIRRRLHAIEAEMLAELSDEELAAMLAGLERIRRRLDAMAKPRSAAE